jgi:hypothetical protein
MQPPSDEVVEHLWNAAHEFLTAMRRLVDAADEFVNDQRDRAHTSESDARLRRIDIDD